MLGLTIYAAMLLLVGVYMPQAWWDAASPTFVLVVGGIAAWRYGWSATHFIRAMIYKSIVFPRMRRKADALGQDGIPSRVYLLITSFRIDTETSMAVFRAAIEEAASLGVHTTIVASIVEMADQRLVKQLFVSLNPPPEVDVLFARIPGTGKRDGLASSFRAISATMPPADAVVCVIDGDSVLSPGALRKTLPFFALKPDMDAMTTDEICQLDRGGVYKHWYNMRFAQRQLQMCSMALSGRVLTLTGRFSLFRANVVCDPEFIRCVQADKLEHWRLGTFNFLTGDDKSSWYHILRSGRLMLYAPDVQIVTIECPPHDNFFQGSTILMRRWFGNMLRNGGRALALGPKPMGLFVWWSVLDQRVSMWTTLVGPVGAIALSLTMSPFTILLYLYWVALTRFAQTLLMLTARHDIDWRYPFLLYYNQVYGSMVKTYVLFRQDRQSWTRQKTAAARTGGRFQRWVLDSGSTTIHTLSASAFVFVVALYVGALHIASPGDIALMLRN